MAINLDSIRSSCVAAPLRTIVYGPEGIGKTTFASRAPNPIFIPTEDGLGSLGVPSFPIAQSYSDVRDAVGALFSGEHEYETVVIDSLDWLEALIWKQVASDHGYANIEEIGYAKGYVFAADLFREVLSGLDALRNTKGMAVVLTAHAQVKRFDDPTSEPYDRYTLKLHAKAASIVQEWADVVGFAAQEMVVKKEDVGFNKKAARGVAVGGHVLNVKRTPAFDAKSRFSIPDTLPLEWSAFADALAASHQPTNHNTNN